MRSAVLLLALAALACEGVSGSTPDAQGAPAATSGECVPELDRVKPLAPSFTLKRNADSKQELSILPACPGGGEGLHVYWFVDYDPAAATIWASEDDPFTLGGCDTSLISGDVHVVEALVTAGELSIDLTSEGDPRSTKGGEPMTVWRWVVHVEGDPNGCTAR